MTQKNRQISTHEVFAAYIVIFQNKPGNSLFNLNGIDLENVHKEYRKRMFQNHPDRAMVLGIDSDILMERSKEITDSFEVLKSFLQSKDSSFKQLNQFKKPASYNKGKKNSNYEYKGKYYHILNEILKLGQFLYYLGIIDFKELVKALQWQKSLRPYFGEIARGQGLLTEDDTHAIYKNRKKNERFGECAVRLGLITEKQLHKILDFQKSKMPKLGEFFIKNNILSSEELEIIVEKLKAHNRQFAEDIFRETA